MININEYLLTKNKTNVVTMPEKGCNIKDIVDWLESYGIQKAKLYFKEPEVGELLYYRGKEDSDLTSHWVAIKGKTKNGFQEVLLRTKFDNRNVFIDTNNLNYSITFEQGLKIILKMIENPNLDIEI